MSTDAERRRIASNLLDLGMRLRYGFDRSQIPMALAIITGSIEKHVISWETILEKLAGIIELEPERTCRVDIHAEERGGRYVWVYTFSCGHEFESYWYMNPRYCLFCGAKVVDE